MTLEQSSSILPRKLKGRGGGEEGGEYACRRLRVLTGRSKVNPSPHRTRTTGLRVSAHRLRRYLVTAVSFLLLLAYVPIRIIFVYEESLT